MNSKGQAILNIAIAVIATFVMISIGMAIIANVQGNTAVTGISVPFNTLWPLVVAGAAIITAIVYGFGARR